MARQALLKRIAGPVLLGAVAMLAVGCGSSSGSASGSSSSSSTTSGPTTTVPSIATVISVCQKASSAASSIGSMLQSAQPSTPMSQIDDEMKTLVAPIQQCETAFRSAIPGLPAAAQAAATAYANSLGPIIESLQDPPPSAEAVSGWVQQFTAQSAAVSEAKAALVQADPSFASF